MYIQNNSSFSYSAPDKKNITAESAPVQTKTSSAISLDNLSEKAVLIFENLSRGLSSSEKEDAAQSLSSIGKAAAFASTNGFVSQNERNVVSQYFGNFSGVVSDEAIRKMIHAKLDNPNFENRVFLEQFAQELAEPLKGINIKV